MPKIAFVGILIRLFFDICFGISYFFGLFFYILAILSMLIGALSALQQQKIKRLLAYSFISHVGFILIGFTSNMLNNISFIWKKTDQVLSLRTRTAEHYTRLLVGASSWWEGHE